MGLSDFSSALAEIPSRAGVEEAKQKLPNLPENAIKSFENKKSQWN